MARLTEERVPEVNRIDDPCAGANGSGRRSSKRGLLPTVVLVLALVVGIGFMAYPTISNWWNQTRQTSVIVAYNEQVSALDQEQITQLRSDAKAFNNYLMELHPRFGMLSDEDMATYEGLLNVSGGGVMGSIRIPSIGVNLPIYHGVDEAVLQVGIGHVESTSLPIGGMGTHTVLSGHRGLPSARLFTDLNLLKEGDRFELRVLGEVLTYQVDQILTVLPDELDSLTIYPDQDLVTLVTCTPYGINSHRLLVRGHRVDGYAAVDPDEVVAEASRIDPLVVAICVTVGATVVVGLGVWLGARLVRKGSRRGW